jgi:hypothetical protein
MKKIISNITLVVLASLSLTSCLKTVSSNVNGENLTSQFLQLEYVKDSSQTTIGSGKQYFGASTLLFDASHTSDTAYFQVTLNGPMPATADVTVNVVTDWTAINDNYANDSITYDKMPDSCYKILTPSLVIKAGTRTAYAKMVVYPNKISPTKSYMAPVSVTNTSNIVTSQNFGHIYFHTIGNPIAGNYTWDFYRVNALAGTYPTGPYASGTFTGSAIAFLPVNTTTVSVPTGYYVQPNYLISFKNTAGVLSNFKAEINPAELNGAFTANGITIVSAPTITVSTDLKKFTINYAVFNGSAYRNCTDVYTKK